MLGAGEEVNDLHPAPVDTYASDHRDTPNRDQMTNTSELLVIWKRTVEALAAELQISPLEAHGMLRDAESHMTIGTAWRWWLDG